MKKAVLDFLLFPAYIYTNIVCFIFGYKTKVSSLDKMKNRVYISLENLEFKSRIGDKINYSYKAYYTGDSEDIVVTISNKDFSERELKWLTDTDKTYSVQFRQE